jgi:hypothetical protein
VPVAGRASTTSPFQVGLKQVDSSLGLAAIAPAVLLYLGLVLYVISLAPSWVGDVYDDGGYYLMSRNVWRFGWPLLNQTGVPMHSTIWSPALSLLLSPLGALPMRLGVPAERLFVALTGAGLLVLSFLWLRREVGLNRRWAAAAVVCLATAPALTNLGSVIMSDIPSAFLLMAAIILLRRGRPLWGTAALILAYAVRAINLAVLIAAVAWLFWQGRRREAWRAALAGGVGVAAWTVLFHSSGYLGAVLQRDLENPSAGRVGIGDLVLRVASQLGHIVSGEASQLVAGAFQSRTLLTHAGPVLIALSVLSLAAAIVGFWRRRLSLEALVCLAILAVVLVWPWDSDRFLVALAPLMVGGIAAALTGRSWQWGAVAVTAVAFASAGSLQQYRAVTPTRAVQAEHVGQLQRLYSWVRTHARPSDVVLTYADIQCYLYSGHPATRDLTAFAPGRTYVVGVPYGSAVHPGLDLDQRLLNGFIGQVVYHDGTVVVLKADARNT